VQIAATDGSARRDPLERGVPGGTGAPYTVDIRVMSPAA
jgi:hypothetical protein